jgi:glucose-6-phosphate-specific signal transduction histidine kinase
MHRIAQESLRNAFRHAQVGHIEMEITYKESLHLHFRDDGKVISLLMDLGVPIGDIVRPLGAATRKAA